jgi:hypothetical protein
MHSLFVKRHYKAWKKGGLLPGGKWAFQKRKSFVMQTVFITLTK